jgi:hypothetical protein
MASEGDNEITIVIICNIEQHRVRYTPEHDQMTQNMEVGPAVLKIWAGC